MDRLRSGMETEWVVDPQMYGGQLVPRRQRNRVGPHHAITQEDVGLCGVDQGIEITSEQWPPASRGLPGLCRRCEQLASGRRD